jgi:hypothetical protein
MLISMPTGTSTIFGVFQAILALLVKSDELRPRRSKVIANEKFASDFLASVLLQRKIIPLTYLCSLLSN